MSLEPTQGQKSTAQRTQKKSRNQMAAMIVDDDTAAGLLTRTTTNNLHTNPISGSVVSNGSEKSQVHERAGYAERRSYNILSLIGQSQYVNTYVKVERNPHQRQ